MTNATAQHWLVIPAAGIGKRMAADIPKQYLSLNGKPVIAHTLHCLHTSITFSAAVVTLAKHDEHWTSLDMSAFNNLHTTVGGKERADSVMAGLQYLKNNSNLQVASRDWVWVHDAARPCVRSEDLTKLQSTLHHCDVGALLGMPVRDTMKEVTGNNNTVLKTLNREQMWHAFTPQVFRFDVLLQAMQHSIDNNFTITDEASAVEQAGKLPVMVEGHADNIKITRPEDLALAEFYLRNQ